MKKHLKTSLLQAFSLLGSSCLFAAGPDGNGNILYVSDYGSANVYQIDTVTNAVSGTISVGSFPSFSSPLGIAISPDGSFAYITDDGQSTVYKVNTANNQVEATLNYGTFTPSYSNGLIAISPNQNFGYVWGDNGFYRIDIPSNQASSILANTTGTNWVYPAVMAITPDNSTAYFTDYSDNLFQVDCLSNAVSQVVSGIGVSECIAINSKGTLAYVTDLNNNVFKIDLKTTPLTPVPVTNTTATGFSQPIGVTFSPDDTTVYVADSSANSTGAMFIIDVLSNSVTNSIPVGNEWNYAAPSIAISPDGLYAYIADDGYYSSSSAVHVVNLKTYTVTDVYLDSSVFPAFGAPTWVALWHYSAPPKPSSAFKFNLDNFSDNDKKVATYLNQYASTAILNLFANSSLTTQKAALESISPERIASATATSQFTVLSITNALQNFLNNYNQQEGAQVSYIQENTFDQDSLVADNFNENSLVALGSKPSKQNKKTNASNPKFNVWVNGFGQYIYDNPKHQTPAFNAASGGFVSGCDYLVQNLYPIGAGVAYAYSSLSHENHMGKGKINQGSIFTYGRFDYHDFYWNIALLGGYYHVNNNRNISFPGYHKTAHSSTNGWQFTPHVEFGYNYARNFAIITPFITLDDVSNWERGFTEQGADLLNMSVKGRYCNLLRVESGLRFLETIIVKYGKLSFLEKISYGYQKAFGTGSITAFLAGSSGSFGLTAFSNAQNLGIGELAFIFEPNNKRCPLTTLNFEATAGSTFQSYLGSCEFAWRF